MTDEPEGFLQAHLDDFLWFGGMVMHEVMDALRVELGIGVEEIDSFTYLGLCLRTVWGSEGFEVVIDQEVYTSQIHEIEISPVRLRDRDQKALPNEFEAFRGVLGQCGWVSGGTHPEATYGTSTLASVVKDLRVRDLVNINKLVRSLHFNKSLCLWYRRSWQSHPLRPTLLVFSDSSLNNLLDEDQLKTVTQQ